MLKKWQDEATTDEQTLSRWWKVNPTANVGVITGGKLLVIDVDPRNDGNASWARFIKRRGNPPDTLTVRTGGNGTHYYFAVGKELPCKPAWMPGVDLKGAGGYVIAPPSSHASGRKYEWTSNGTPITKAPPWLMDKLGMDDPLRDDPQRENIYTIHETNDILRDVRAYIAECEGVGEGERNDKAFKIAGHAHSFKALHDNEIFDLMHEWNDRCSPPLELKELMEVVQSARVNGKPREPKRPHSMNGVYEHEGQNGELLLSDLVPVGQFLRQSLKIDYLVPFVAVARQPGVISARSKSLKTTIAVDLNISMATATKFLGVWPVPNIDRRLPHGNRFENLTNQKFGARTVLGFAGFRGRFAVWLCRCKCGQLSVIKGGHLRSGKVGSCGCTHRLNPAAKMVESVLRTIKARCYNKNDPSYHLYGGRGITVCKRWRESVEAFAHDMGPRPSAKHSIARRNERGNYTPENCYWGTLDDVYCRHGRLITYNGKTQNLSRWADELGISREAMRRRVKRRIRSGLGESAAITTILTAGRPRLTL